MQKYIEATYQLIVNNDGKEQIIEETTKEKPLKFYTGLGMTIEEFEKNIEPYNEGDDFEFVIPKGKAFNDYNPEMVIDIPREDLAPDGELDPKQVFIGATLPLQNQGGQRFLARVVNIDDDNVRVDLNHPLAGKDLTFRGHIISSHEASEEEIDELKKKLRRHHCGGGCGSCHSGNCGKGNCGDGSCCESNNA